MYPLQKPIEEEVGRLQRQQIIVSLSVDDTLEWCSSFVLVPKANGIIQLVLDLARFNKALIRPVHRGPILNDILPRLAPVEYLTLIDASSGYYNLKLDQRSLYLTIFSCSYGR